jgi:hypothetical protein
MPLGQWAEDSAPMSLIERAAEVGAIGARRCAGCDLQQQGRLADTGLAAQQDRGTGNNSAT